jgi:hypothetical protein
LKGDSILRGFLAAHEKLLIRISVILDRYTNRQKLFRQNFVCASKSVNVQGLSQPWKTIQTSGAVLKWLCRDDA